MAASLSQPSQSPPPYPPPTQPRSWARVRSVRRRQVVGARRSSSTGASNGIGGGIGGAGVGAGAGAGSSSSQIARPGTTRGNSVAVPYVRACINRYCGGVGLLDWVMMCGTLSCCPMFPPLLAVSSPPCNRQAVLRRHPLHPASAVVPTARPNGRIGEHARHALRVTWQRRPAGCCGRLQLAVHGCS